MGLIETLLFLKKRGILLAIVSKNDEQFIVSNWNQIVQGQIALTDFAARKINFRSKADNLAEILREMNLRPAERRHDRRQSGRTRRHRGRACPACACWAAISTT